jgi:hypothetical protein
MLSSTLKSTFGRAKSAAMDVRPHRPTARARHRLRASATVCDSTVAKLNKPFHQLRQLVSLVSHRRQALALGGRQRLVFQQQRGEARDRHQGVLSLWEMTAKKFCFSHSSRRDSVTSRKIRRDPLPSRSF